MAWSLGILANNLIMNEKRSRRVITIVYNYIVILYRHSFWDRAKFSPSCIADTWEPAKAGSIRLTGGPDSSAGRVEIFLNGEWGTVCNSGWSMKNSEVVCRELEHSGAVQVTDSRSFGSGGGHIWLSSVECVGNESRLIDCPRVPTTCSSHTTDVGVVCKSECDVNHVMSHTVKHTNAMNNALHFLLHLFLSITFLVTLSSYRNRLMFRLRYQIEVRT